MPEYYEPKSIAPILQQGAATQVPYLAKMTGAAGGLSALGDLAPAAAGAEISRDKALTLAMAQRDYANYLALSPQERAIPENAQHGMKAALALGIQPKQEEVASPDVWNALQGQAGIKTDSPGTKVNVQASEALARLKSGQKLAGDRLAAGKTAAAGKQGAGDDKFWQQSFKLFTPTNASRGSLVGQAAFGNARADRALTTLSDPHITPQQITAVVNDFAGIMQGGAPHENALREMGFHTLSTDWANLMMRLKSAPQDANQPEVVAKLRSMVGEIKKVDNQIIQNNLDTFEAANSGPISRNQDKWNKIRASVTRGTLAPGESMPGAVPAGEKKDSLGLGI